MVKETRNVGEFDNFFHLDSRKSEKSYDCITQCSGGGRGTRNGYLRYTDQAFRLWHAQFCYGKDRIVSMVS